ncbi:MAG TPA: 2,3-diaminopropionate biosynthesis protein SbnB [Blastocatellia bacterium]|nr:2,3-diaminopropionate biosynthesis protein SbnB [Blastocatellia bacterium]
MPMETSSILILKASEILSLLKEQEAAIIETVKEAYLTHAAGASSLPHSSFLRFPNDEVNRIIALPAYLGGDFEISGLKWISSFPANNNLGMERASAVIILNSTRTGRPRAIFEGAAISAQRTAASAALAARYLHREDRTSTVGLIGCGPINFEIVKFLRAVFPGIRNLIIFDTQPDRCRSFGERCRNSFAEMQVRIAGDAQEVLRSSPLISVATTAVKPHISQVPGSLPGTTILHISLRDLSAEVILAGDNVVDDIDHVCRANTSVHLAEQVVSNRNFIRCTLADVINGQAPARGSDLGPSIFSPFGLGILDLAVSKWVYDEATRQGIGTMIDSFSAPE